MKSKELKNYARRNTTIQVRVNMEETDYHYYRKNYISTESTSMFYGYFVDVQHKAWSERLIVECNLTYD